MLIRRSERFRYSDVTPYSLYLNRRSFMGLGLRGGLIAGAAALGLSPLDARAATPKGQALAASTAGRYRKVAHTCVRRAVELGRIPADQWPPTPTGPRTCTPDHS